MHVWVVNSALKARGYSDAELADCSHWDWFCWTTNPHAKVQR